MSRVGSASRNRKPHPGTPDLSVSKMAAGQQGGGKATGPDLNLTLKQVFFSNLRLLGFNVAAYQAQHSIPFNRDMFDLPNKAGAEVVLHFLFSRLNPDLCKEEFRNCWPVVDKKSEQLFRRVCNNWLSNIQKQEADSRLPRVGAAVFMSPGGRKFYQLLFYFSDYVLRTVLHQDLGCKASKHLAHPLLTRHNKQVARIMARCVRCGVVRQRRHFLDQLQTGMLLRQDWTSHSEQLVKEYRRLVKKIRDLEFELREQNQVASDKAQARGSPRPGRHQTYSASWDRDAHLSHRSQRVHKVRDLWKQLENFQAQQAGNQTVVESILDHALHAQRIDARNLDVKVPDLLLRQCEHELHRRHVDNTYKEGKLNLISLVQLWNLSLHLYIERFMEVGVPELEGELEELKPYLQECRTHLHSTRNLSARMQELLPLLKTSVQQLRSQGSAAVSQRHSTPQRTRPEQLQLLPPTPPLSFTPGETTQSNLPFSSLEPPPQADKSTPVLARELMEEMAQNSRRHHSSLFPPAPSTTESRDNTNRSRPGSSAKQLTSSPLSHRSQSHRSSHSSRQQSSLSQATQDSTLTELTHSVHLSDKSQNTTLKNRSRLSTQNQSLSDKSQDTTLKNRSQISTQNQSLSDQSQDATLKNRSHHSSHSDKSSPLNGPRKPPRSLAGGARQPLEPHISSLALTSPVSPPDHRRPAGVGQLQEEGEVTQAASQAWGQRGVGSGGGSLIAQSPSDAAADRMVEAVMAGGPEEEEEAEDLATAEKSASTEDVMQAMLQSGRLSLSLRLRQEIQGMLASALGDTPSPHTGASRQADLDSSRSSHRGTQDLSGSLSLNSSSSRHRLPQGSPSFRGLQLLSGQGARSSGEEWRNPGSANSSFSQQDHLSSSLPFTPGERGVVDPTRSSGPKSSSKSSGATQPSWSSVLSGGRSPGVARESSKQNPTFDRAGSFQDQLEKEFLSALPSKLSFSGSQALAGSGDDDSDDDNNDDYLTSTKSFSGALRTSSSSFRNQATGKSSPAARPDEREASERGAKERGVSERGVMERGAKERGLNEKEARERGTKERGSSERGVTERGGGTVRTSLVSGNSLASWRRARKR